MSTRIFIRSPYIRTINQTGQTPATVKIYFTDEYNPFPTTPDYTLTKAIPSSTNTAISFDYSPYAKEFITHKAPTINTTSINGSSSQEKYVRMQVKAYYDTTLIDTIEYLCLDGYTETLNGINYDNGRFYLDEGTYYYDSAKNTSEIYMSTVSGEKIKYTNLVSGASSTTTFGSSISVMYHKALNYVTDGNKVEILSAVNAVLRTYYFRPITECKYSTVAVDFINKYGFNQRTYFYKASVDTVEVESKEYKPNIDLTVDYSIQNHKQTLNVQSYNSIKVNSGWVEESFNSVLRQLLNSECIYINGVSASLVSKQLTIDKHINTKNINYQLDFKFNVPNINTVV